ncbi:MAG: histidine phosphatase family protein [Actinomycetaceae bacterium]|nr:histidine phosphatase family protein [Actinomycetaceae bacterium]
MTASTIVLLRHGQTDHNAEGRIQGQIDIPLNDLGRAQAAAMAKVLAPRLLDPVDLDAAYRGSRVPLSGGAIKVVSSPLSRAVDTASPLAALLGVAVETDDVLKERNFGLWEGMTGPEIRERWPAEHKVWRGGGDPEGVGVETRLDLGLRVAAGLRRLAKGMSEGGTLVCVAHGSAITQGLSVLLDLDPQNWFGMRGLYNCHWAVVTPQGRRPGWLLQAYNVS